MAKRRKGKATKAKKSKRRRAPRKAAESVAITSAGAANGPAGRPSRQAVRSTRQTINGDPTSVSLLHAASPFGPRIVQALDVGSLRSLAYDYLQLMNEQENLEFPQKWLDALAQGGDDSIFGWMPVGWPPADENEPDAGNPFVSFRVERQVHGDEQPGKTVVLLASERLAGSFIGSGFGISIIVNALRQDGELRASVAGMSASLPYGPYRQGLWTADWAELRRQPEELLAALHAEPVKRTVETALGLQENSVFIRGARLYSIGGDDEWSVERRGTGRLSSRDDQPYLSFVVAGTPDSAGAVISKSALQADAYVNARVFPFDPASQTPPPPPASQDLRARRPSRSDDELDYYRTNTQILSPLTLSDAQGHELMRVVLCPDFVHVDAYPGAVNPKTVNVAPGGPPVHSNDFSAISAWYNVKQLFDRLTAYGLRPFNYFHIAKLPLKIHYRSGIRPGPGKDGNVVNACVLPEGWPLDFVGPTPISQRPTIGMHLALADKTRRGRKPWTPQPWDPIQNQSSQAEPLGIAADDRWIWHEIGHVLLMARVGELELRFAHSPGDALAAIVLDPESYLSDPASAPEWPEWRGATFPWTFIPRRHDRCVCNGWSWGGTLHRAMAEIPNSVPPRRKAYLSEQILSSSLFRLYRSLGGDTLEDISVRRTASHYSAYLIMLAIKLFHTSAAVDPINDPTQFEELLELADTSAATGNWTVTFPPGVYSRIGGCAHKVIRWAFEAQGLFAPAGAITNAPGLPPAADAYIADRRPPDVTDEFGTIVYGPGNYVPVSLYWDDNQTGASPVPLWQASAQAIEVQGNNIKVRVGNRGTQPATNVAVSVRWCRWPANTPPPRWNDNAAGWQPPIPQVLAVPNINRGDEAEVNFNHVPPAGRYIVVAMVNCDGDPANTNAAIPCSYLATPLVDLVSGDNNIGLRVIGP
jgi:hypothetical protein